MFESLLNVTALVVRLNIDYLFLSVSTNNQIQIEFLISRIDLSCCLESRPVECAFIKRFPKLL